MDEFVNKRKFGCQIEERLTTKMPPELSSPPKVTPRVFHAVQRVKVSSLAECEDAELRPVLASLVRMSLIASLDKSSRCTRDRIQVLEVLSRIELVNNLVALLSIDFHALETDVRKEQQLRAKIGSTSGESVLISNLSLGPALEFERSDASRRLRLVLSELLVIIGQIQLQNNRNDESGSTQSGSNSITVRHSELFDHLVYLSEVCDVLCIAMAELPMLLSPPEVSEALLRLKYGPWVICHIVANQPDSFNEVVFHLLRNGDKQDDDVSNSIRQQAIVLLSEMNPTEIVNVRSKCIEWCRMPSLALQLTVLLQKSPNADQDDLVSFMSGLLLGSDPQIRSWISFFVRSGQKKQNENLIVYRKHLTERLSGIVNSIQTNGGKIDPKIVVKASALLRLYTALRGIAGMKFSEEEVHLMFEIITSQPPPNPAGVKFVSLGLCMLIACNSLIAQPELEKRAITWIKWLVSEEDFFEQTSGVSASFGEMLLLMAIHFHSSQVNAISDLICQTLGMKIVVRSNSMNRMKAIFTQDIFTEPVVASHAVKVLVTKNLSSHISGFLPVHCIHQLLKSRTFSKHKVPIKNWIYRQICESTAPLHPVLPSLIELYVNSILVPASNRGIQDQTNEPITEEEIKAVFKVPAFESPVKKMQHTPRKHIRLSPSLNKLGSSGNNEAEAISFGLVPQILLLYYVMLYEHVRLTHMRSIMLSQRKTITYSRDLLFNLPIKYLLQATEKQQDYFGGIFPQLLKLCSTQFPHLCLVQDWLNEEAVSQDFEFQGESKQYFNASELTEAFACLKTCPSKLSLMFQKLLKVPPKNLWSASDLFVSQISNILDEDIPRQIKTLYSKLWFQMNSVIPLKLWLKTVDALVHADKTHYYSNSSNKKSYITQEDLILDPLQVLRCEKKVFLCGPMLEIVLYMLKALLAASRTYLSEHILNNPMLERTPTSQVSSDMEREELKNALVATQESAAIQILLEVMLKENKPMEKDTSMLNDLKEIQSIICSYLHETFIADPNLAKLVHFQGYPLELLAITVPGVPSIHICLDFVPELLSQPDLEKQIFAVDLISHLSVQYTLPKAYSTARLAVNALSTLLSVLTVEERNVLFPPVLPSFVRFCKAFPPLIEDVTNLLLQYGKICISESCLKGYCNPRSFDMTSSMSHLQLKENAEEGESRVDMAKLKEKFNSESLPKIVVETFNKIVEEALNEKRVF